MMHGFKRFAVSALICLFSLPLFYGFWDVSADSPAYAAGTRMTLSPSMVTNETGLGDATMLVDEQAAAGDPKDGLKGTPTTQWFPGWNNASYPASAYIDLGQAYNLTDIYLFDSNNVGDFTVSAGSPGNWTPLFTDDLINFQVWKGHPVNVTTQYIRVTMAAKTSLVAEIVLYGTPAGGSDTTAPAAIPNLSLGYVSASSVNLMWTTTGDDGDIGTASSYDIRYSASPITEGNWAGATQVSGEPAPYPAGYDQAFNVTGLSANTTYYFAIKAVDEAGNASPLSNVPVTTSGSGQAGGKIKLDPSMVTNTVLGGDIGMLVDEQAAAGDPRAGDKITMNTKWFPGWSAALYPASAVIDLGAQYNLTDVYFFDATSNDKLDISTGTPSAWTKQFTDELLLVNKWSGHSLTGVTTRYVEVKLYSTKSNINEIVLYGTPLAPLSPPSPPAPVLGSPAEPVNVFMGTNAFVDDPIDKLLAVGSVREYHNWRWDETADRLHAYQPSYAGGGNWNFDTYYANVKNAGLSLVTTLQDSVTWLTAKTSDKPIASGADPNDPASYTIHANHVYQAVARYGSRTVPDANLKLAAGQPRLSGLNTVKYYEDWNEQNRTWFGDAGYFLPFNYAAMASADYDGDQGRLGTTYGLKNADPNAKMVMGGLVGVDVDYIKTMKYWSDWKRGGSFPADVLNVHDYCTTGMVGVSPEAGGLKDRINKLVKFRNQYLPGVPIWITEFGYDTHPASPQSAPVIGGNSNQEVQGQWLVRSYLELASAGVDRAYMYMLRDVDGTSKVKYNTSGLVTSQMTGQTPKISWYYVSTLKNVLTGMNYAGEQSSGNANVKIYKFKAANGAGVYAIWSPTANDTKVNGYSLALQGSPTTATLVTMQDGDSDGVAAPLTISGGHVSVNVSERPVFVQVNQMP